MPSSKNGITFAKPATAIPMATTTNTFLYLPTEISDAIIDHLYLASFDDQLPTPLAVTSLVSRSFLIRSRHHMFSTVRLKLGIAARKHLNRFFELLQGDVRGHGSSHMSMKSKRTRCTFANQVQKLEIVTPADSIPSLHQSAELIPLTLPELLQLLTVGLPSRSSPTTFFPHLKTVSIYNTNWTGLSLSQRRQTLDYISHFTSPVPSPHSDSDSNTGVSSLELHNSTFHDIRDILRLAGADVFPTNYPPIPGLSLSLLNINFAKYLEYNLSLAQRDTLGSLSWLRGLEVDGEDEGVIPVILSAMKVGKEKDRVLERLTLRNIKSGDWKYIHEFMQSMGTNSKSKVKEVGLRNLEFGLAEVVGTGSIENPREADILGALNFGHLSQLETLNLHGIGLTVSSSSSLFCLPPPSDIIESNLSHILAKIESSCLSSIELGFIIPQSALQDLENINFNWPATEKALLALHFFGMKRVYISVDIDLDSGVDEDREAEGKLESYIRSSMPDLCKRGVLFIDTRNPVEEVETASLARSVQGQSQIQRGYGQWRASSRSRSRSKSRIR